MSSIETMEDLRQFVMEHGLPATEMTLFGVKCPYCGKSDQIKKLESPDDLTDVIETDALAAYSSFFKKKATARIIDRCLLVLSELCELYQRRPGHAASGGLWVKTMSHSSRSRR